MKAKVHVQVEAGAEAPAQNAVDLARDLYAKHGLDFQADLNYYLAHGFVVALPTCFAMAAAIKSDGREIDTWFVKVAAGDLWQLVRLIPVPLPFIAFARYPRNQMLRIYRTARVKRLAVASGDCRMSESKGT